MFDIFFGWRKASKCKKLVRRVQCRLKLLKNKRCSIVKMLREDIAELLRHGHEQTAFDRVEQLYKDETTAAIYDLLENFCEFIIINFPYIRKHKDCPNDINEAVSSLIYASARFGDLPELILIRKLFGERYGQRFATVALQLLPGNLVNREMKEKFCVQSISEDAKYKLVDEIARSCFQSGPLLIEYSPLLANNSSVDQILSTDYVINPDRNENDKELVNSSVVESETKVFYVDLSSEHKFIKDPSHSRKESSPSVPSSCFSTTSQAASNAGDSSMIIKPGEMMNTDLDPTVSGPKRKGNSASYKTRATGFRRSERDTDVASSESSDKLPMEMIYLDDIEEFESPLSKEGNFQDQRLFMFKSAISPKSEKLNNRDNKNLKEQSESKYEKRESRGFRSGRKMSGKRLRRRLISLEKRSIVDMECAIYYGESCESSPNSNHKSHHRRKHHKKVAIKEKTRSDCAQGSADVHPCFVNVTSSSFTFVVCTPDHLNSNCSSSFTGRKVGNCSLEGPCYSCASDETDELKYPTSLTMTENATLKRLSSPRLCQKTDKNGSCYYEEPDHERARTMKGSQDSALLSDNLVSPGYLSRKIKKHFNGQVVAGGRENEARRDPVISTCSTMSNSSTMKVVQPPYMRAITMPPERLKDNSTDNIFRSISFPVQQPSHLQDGSVSNPHIHPKLPDYDDLAAKFSALKKEYLQSKK